MILYLLVPENAGDMGPKTVVTNLPQLRSREARVPEVSYLEYSFDQWYGDDLLEVYPCFIVTDQLAQAMLQAELTGFRLEPVEVTTSEGWDQRKQTGIEPGPEPPHFHRLLPTGTVEFTAAGQIVRWSGDDVNFATCLDRDASTDPPDEEDTASTLERIAGFASLAVTDRCLAVL